MLKNKFWLENLKSMIAMGFVGLILFLIVYFKFIKEDNRYQNSYNPYMVSGNMQMGTQSHTDKEEKESKEQ